MHALQTNPAVVRIEIMPVTSRRWRWAGGKTRTSTFLPYVSVPW